MTDELLNGFKTFHKDYYEGEYPLMPRLVRQGQRPDYFIISCIDSRTNPATLFQARPGIFFAHKAMGAIVRPYKKGTALAAALHFSLNYSNVKAIIVLGHTDCGAVKALVEGLPDEEISSFVEVAQAGLDRANALAAADDSCLFRHTEEQIVLQSVENLKTYPSVQKALDENRLEIKPWLFDMQNGDLLEYDETKKEFVITG